MTETACFLYLLCEGKADDLCLQVLAFPEQESRWFG
jgi:hypothetical protein